MRKTPILFVLLFNGLFGQQYQVDSLPSELDDSEAMFRKKGVLQTFPEDNMKWNDSK